MPRNRFITSDLHIGHKNILAYDKRPFSTVQEHDEALIENWNKLVKPNDLVYCLGDVVWSYRKETIIETLGRLQGKIHLVIGNHDGMLTKPGIRERFEKIENMTILKLSGEFGKTGKLYVTLCHYAMKRWIKSHRPNSYHLYGHSHGQLKDQENLSFDVGIMLTQYHPMPWEVMKKVMQRRIARGFGPTVHHRGTR